MDIRIAGDWPLVSLSAPFFTDVFAEAAAQAIPGAIPNPNDVEIRAVSLSTGHQHRVTLALKGAFRSESAFFDAVAAAKRSVEIWQAVEKHWAETNAYHGEVAG